MENLVKALEERTEEKKGLKLSERVMLKAKYVSKRRGPGGKFIYKYAVPVGGKKRPKESLYSKEQKQKKAQAVGEKLPIGKEYKPIVAELIGESVKNLKTVMGHGFKVPSIKELSENAFEGHADMLDDDYKTKREEYSDMMYEEYNKMSEKELGKELMEEGPYEKEDIKEMSKEDMLNEMMEGADEMADDMSGSDVTEMVYGSPEKMAKDSPGELAMVLEGDIENYLDENNLR